MNSSLPLSAVTCWIVLAQYFALIDQNRKLQIFSKVSFLLLLILLEPRYPKGMYSCIAGFLDAGEAIEVTSII